jgi:hypothetical protein
MNETPQQYVARILGHIEGHDPLKVQRSTADKLSKLIRGVPRGKLGKRPALDKWSVTEILAHLAETEWAVGFRLRMILSSNGTPVQAFNQDDWARTSNYAKWPPRESLALFRTLRNANLALLKSIPEEKWEYYGMHAERGQETVSHIFRLIASHDLNHLGQIQRILGRK